MYSHGGHENMNKPDVFYRKVGENIRAKRKDRGLSQEGLAKAVGLKRPSMSNIEKGRQNILLHTFCDIAETLDSNPSALLPERLRPEPGQMPDLTSFSKEVREFVEAAIKPAKKEDSDGHSKTKN
jgi:transcriptional regulator with XRE-family HTH domain